MRIQPLWLRRLLVIAIGGVAGWSYWYWIGCQNGSCPITSSPVVSTMYGMLMAGLWTGTQKRS